MSFADLVQTELAKARAKHPTELNNPHLAYAVILEELDEFWDEVRKQTQSDSDMLAELVSVAAMAQRAAEDLGLVLSVSAPKKSKVVLACVAEPSVRNVLT